MAEDSLPAPPVFPPPPAPPRPIPPPRPAGGGGAAKVVLAIFFAVSALLNLVLLLALLVVGSAASVSSAAGSRFLEKPVLGTGAGKFALVTLRGVIQEGGAEGGLFAVPDPVEEFQEKFRRAARDPLVRGVLLEIDSPGGGLTASDVLYREVRRFRDESKKPVVASIGDLGASGGYYVAVACDSIVAHPTSLVGSIGVILIGFDLRGLSEKIGVKDRTFKSSKSDKKDMLSPFKEVTPEEREIVQTILDEYHDLFIRNVADGRKLPVADATRLADGRIFTARQALKEKLVDAVGYREDAFAALKKLAGTTEGRLVRYSRPGGLAGLFGARGPGGPALAVPTTAEILDRALPRPWAVWPGP